MGETVHEYVVLNASGEYAQKVEVGQMLYFGKYQGKERTWQFVNTKTMEETGTITGLHRRKTTREAVKAESQSRQQEGIDEADRAIAEGEG